MTRVTEPSLLPTPARREYSPGDVITGKYRLHQLLGEGGMGSVWVAENMALKANVALKLIRADVAEPSANERFLSEARLAARLQHASIVRVFDFGTTENEEPFIVMELLEGETLGQRLTRLGSIDPTELIQTLLPIVDALHSAHGHGVIHRDLKPDNVFIAKTDGGGVQPKLLDFGIAKLRGESSFHTTKLTQAGTLIGSPDYMSPEQARGELDLDPRSDVWALCVLAYECLVGKPPFHGDNYNALLWSIIHDEPVPITVFQAGDSELWRIVKTGFSKDRNGRWASARKLGEALAGWLENHGVVEDVCNRSLHASWLPAERPTRPELAPFNDLTPPPPQRVSSHSALVPPATLPGLRRPHTMSLWVAGAGLATLMGALLLTGSEDDDDGALAAPASSSTEVFKAEPGVRPGSTSGASSGSYSGNGSPESGGPGSTGPSARRDNGGLPIGQASPGVANKPASLPDEDRPLNVNELDEVRDTNSASDEDDRPKRRSASRTVRAAKAATVNPAASRTKQQQPARTPRKKDTPEQKSDAEYDFGI
jgi:serine/threonine protein kinase